MTRQLFTLLFLIATVTSQAQDWEQLNNIPFLRDHTNGFGLGNKAYVFTGAGSEVNGYFSKGMWEYDPDSDNWTQLDDFPGAARGIAIGDDWQGKYYYGFGVNNTGYLTDVWVFDPADNSFGILPSCPCIGRSHPAFVAHNDKIFMGSGTSDDGDLKDWWVYDMVTEEWSQKADIPGEVRHHPFQFAIDNKVYVGGGHKSNWAAWDIETEEWTEINNYPEGRVAGTQFSFNGKGYALSGDNAQHGPLMPGDYFLEYDPTIDQWEVLPSHPGTNRWAPSSFLIDGYVYLFGGYASTGNDLRMWRYKVGDVVISSTEEINNAENLVQLSPNPFSSDLQIGFDAEVNSSSDLAIYDLLGKQVYASDHAPQQILDLSFLQSGVYVLTLNVDGTIVSKKIVKQ